MPTCAPAVWPQRVSSDVTPSGLPFGTTSRLSDQEVIDEIYRLGPLRRVVHAGDDGVALIAEKRGDDRVEPDVVEFGFAPEPLGDLPPQVDVGADWLRSLKRFHRWVGNVGAEDELLLGARRRAEERRAHPPTTMAATRPARECWTTLPCDTSSRSVLMILTSNFLEYLLSPESSNPLLRWRSPRASMNVKIFPCRARLSPATRLGPPVASNAAQTKASAC